MTYFFMKNRGVSYTSLKSYLRGVEGSVFFALILKAIGERTFGQAEMCGNRAIVTLAYGKLETSYKINQLLILTSQALTLQVPRQYFSIRSRRDISLSLVARAGDAIRALILSFPVLFIYQIRKNRYRGYRKLTAQSGFGPGPSLY